MQARDVRERTQTTHYVVSHGGELEVNQLTRNCLFQRNDVEARGRFWIELVLKVTLPEITSCISFVPDVTGSI